MTLRAAPGATPVLDAGNGNQASGGIITEAGSADVVNGRASVTLDKPLNKKGVWTCEAKYHGDDPFRRDSVHFHITVV